MKILQILIFAFLLINCKKSETNLNLIGSKEEYIFDYHDKNMKTEDYSKFLGNDNYRLEQHLEVITKKEFIQDSLKYKNDIATSDNLLQNSNKLSLPYGYVSFIKNNKKDSDDYVNYTYIGFSQVLQSHIIRISLYESEALLLLNNNKYEYKIINEEPIISYKATSKNSKFFS